MNKDVQKENQALVDAAIAASGQLAAAKVPHCLVGRLGLLSQGYGGADDEPITEIEFLVDSSAAFMSVGPSKVFVVKAALPISSLTALPYQRPTGALDVPRREPLAASRTPRCMRTAVFA